MNEITITFDKKYFLPFKETVNKHKVLILFLFLCLVSTSFFLLFYKTGLGLAYNDARSHLDIGRRVVEGLKPGLAQLGSVWLPLPHILMIPTIWNDFMWHSGLAGAIISMISFVITGVVIYFFLKKLGVSTLGRVTGTLVFIANMNILYLQSTAMTELLLIMTMTIAAYELLLWFDKENIVNLVKAAFWVMLSTTVRYDGWFLLIISVLLIAVYTWKKRGFKVTEGVVILFCTLGGLGIFSWLLWNQLIFKDALYFAFGPYSAHAQQQQLAKAGDLPTKGNLFISTQVYLYAFIYNSGAFIVLLGIFGAIFLWFSKNVKPNLKIASLVLLTPLFFNIIALYLGHSVLFVQGISGNSWFNARYGVMMVPSLAIFIGFLVDKQKRLQPILLGLLFFFCLVFVRNFDAVTIDDARVGSSQKNVTEVSGWLNKHAKNKPGFILISAASHDAIIFSSGLPMSKFIHEGTGAYWLSATTSPDRWARWIIMRTHDLNDQTFKLVSKSPGFKKYNLVGHYPFADIYEIKPAFVKQLQTKPILGKQK